MDESTITHWYQGGFMVEDQRFAARRPDVLVDRTLTLGSAVTVSGPVDVAFNVSTSGTDSHWTVKVIDVFLGSGVVANPRAPNVLASVTSPLDGPILWRAASDLDLRC